MRFCAIMRDIRIRRGSGIDVINMKMRRLIAVCLDAFFGEKFWLWKQRRIFIRDSGQRKIWRDIEARFFFRLADDRFVRIFVPFDMTARRNPSVEFFVMD